MCLSPKVALFVQYIDFISCHLWSVKSNNCSALISVVILLISIRQGHWGFVAVSGNKRKLLRVEMQWMTELYPSKPLLYT